MNMFLRISATTALCAFGAVTASHAQSVTCQNAQFDPAVLEKYPNLPTSCLEIVKRNGEDYAVVKARLDRVNANGSVQVRVRQPDGSYGERRILKSPNNLKVLVQGKPAELRDLATGQEITAYVKVAAPVMALAPAEETTPLVLTPLEETQPVEQTAAVLPTTASPVPLFGAIGAAFLLLGAMLSAFRNWRR